MSTPPAASRRTLGTHVGLLLVTIAALSACFSEAKPKALDPVRSPTTSSTPGCPASGVAITPAPVDAAMGLRAMRIDLLNCGTAPYTLQGYPAVRVLDADRRPLDVTVLDGTAKISRIERFDGPPKRVTAAPGGHLAAVVVWRNSVTDVEVSAATGRYLEIAPADGRPAQTVTPEGGIDLGTTGRLAVSAWTTPPTG
ncbi:DUF4232 domain-containing protein [Actinomadura alba]|uniref:DUF4232 domain-containing protein n=1 Tax=Actinomadura alba TaxID=406431 RepID=UPI001C9CEDA0|nr:DUF4232 domain-containing protein [Actinomadura alba]